MAKTEQEVREENEDFFDGKESWYTKIYETVDRNPKEDLKKRIGGKISEFGMRSKLLK